MYNDLLAELNIRETYTKAPRLPKKFNRVKDNIPLIADYNFMADLYKSTTATKEIQPCQR